MPYHIKFISGPKRRLVSIVAMSLLFAACAGTPVGAGTDVTAGQTLAGNYLAGRHAQSEGDMDAASVYLGAALQIDPEQADLIRRTFLVYLSDARYDDAFGLAEQIVEFDPGDVFAVMSLASRDLKAGNFEAARARLANVAQEGISAYLAPLLVAWAYTGDGNVDAALEAIAHLKQSPATAMLHEAHAALIQASVGNTGEAEKLFGTLMEGQGGLSLRTTELLGALYEKTGQLEKAAALYNGYRNENGDTRLMNMLLARVEKRKLSPESSSESSNGNFMTAAEGAAEAMLDLTGSLRQQNAHESALLLARLGLYLHPSFPTFELITGSTLEDIGRYEDANAIYAELDPNSAYAWNAQLRIATNLDILGKTDEAIVALRRMADENLTEAGPLIDLGDILRSAERFSEAVDAYDEAFGRLPEASHDRYWSLYYARGIALERSKNWGRAEADLLKALEYKPDQPYVLNYLGYSWIEKRMNLDRAEDMVRKAVSLRPNDGYIVDSLGWVYYQLGDFDNAVSELERAVELLPEDPVINDHLGDAYWRVGRQREARFQWRRSASLDPESEIINTVREKIENGMSDPVTANDSGGNG